MKLLFSPFRILVSVILFAALVIAPGCASFGPPSSGTLVMVIMDPLAGPLACPCVKGYAQRDYPQLAAFLSKRIGRLVRVVYGESLDKALRGVSHDRVTLIIGKQSVVKSDAHEVGMTVRPLCQLTGKDGSTTITGLFIVKTSDFAQTISDLKGRTILFGPADSDEKNAAAVAALRAAGITLPDKIETRPGCSDAAFDVQDAVTLPLPAAVISSYALPLLEGCGSIDRGSLRVIGKTEPVPFVTAFSTGATDPGIEAQITQALLDVRNHPSLLKAIESRNGFVTMPAVAAGWPGWRGANRDGQTSWLPGKLPAAPQFIWRKPLVSSALAGLAATDGVVIVADRDFLDQSDVFFCFRADNGELLWRLEYPAAGDLDYGPSARATPSISEGKVYLLGALGTLHCIELSTGKVIWKKDLAAEFNVKPPTWGWCSAPLLVDDKLIVNPGAPDAAIVALNRATGKVLWKTPGAPPAYAAFICGRFGGRRQIIGYDVSSLGGWDPATGKRLWELVPPKTGDFNVPTPLDVDGRLLVATENNGTRLYAFNADGTIIPKPIAENATLTPDASSPVIFEGKVLGCSAGLHALDLAGGLKTLWTTTDEGFDDFASLIASDNRVLAVTFRGELWLLSPQHDGPGLISRLRVLDNESELYSHPAIDGHRLFLRDRNAICCIPLDSATPSARTTSSSHP